MFRFLTAGESHGPALTAIVEGLPAGLKLDADQINADLARRQQGFGRGGRMKIEKDTAAIMSGVRFGVTLGSPVTLVISNRDWANWQERMAVFGEPQGDRVVAPRPGHADLPGLLKYQRDDVRDILERASARETAARVAVGGVAKQLLNVVGIAINSKVTTIGGVQEEEQMHQVIAKAKEAGDTLGGIFEVVASNVLPGLGSHVQWTGAWIHVWLLLLYQFKQLKEWNLALALLMPAYRAARPMMRSITMPAGAIIAAPTTPAVLKAG